MDHAVWWHVYPLGFAGADVGGGDRSAPHPDAFTRLEHWLDYAVRLGVSGLALGPVFESATHGYDTLDHYRIDSRLGTEAGFDRLVEEAHRRGLRILLDGVFNHVARPLADRHPGWVRRRNGEEEVFEGHGSLVALDHLHPEVQEYVTGVMDHWLERGADGWRLDAAYAVRPEFWATVLPAVRGRHPGAWFVGEVIHGDYAAYVEASTLDSVTQYELWKATWSSLNDGNFFELAWALDRHGQWAESFLPMTFVGNHDVTRLATRLADRRHLGHALVVLMTVAGVPSVYYGDEQAFEGVKEERVGGDDAIRPAFPADESALVPFGWPVYRLHQDLIGVRRRHPWLQRGRVEVRRLENTCLVYDAAAPGGEGRVTVTLNIGTGAVPVEGEPVLRSEPGGGPVGPHGWAITTPG